MLFGSKTGFLDHTLPPISVKSGEPKQHLRVPLTPAAFISGRIVDQYGEPISHVEVIARRQAGPPERATRPAGSEPAVTDYGGSYVIGGLEQGLYIVTVGRVGAGPLFEHDAVFFPSASTPEQATTIDLKAGSERFGVDMTVTMRPPLDKYRSTDLVSEAPDAGSIAGVVKDTSGRGLAHSFVVMQRTRPENPENRSRTAIADAQGRFQFDRVPPERVRLTASRPGFELAGTAGRTEGLTEVNLGPGQRVNDVALTLTRSGVVAGTLVDQFGDPEIGTVHLLQTGTLQRRFAARTNARGQFQISSVMSGEYLIAADHQPFDGPLRTTDAPGHELTVALLPVYFPDVYDDSRATPIRLSSGVDLSGLEVVLRPQPVSSIEIDLVPSERPTQNLTIERHSPGGSIWAPERGTISPDGRRWMIDSTPAGRHVIVASATEAGAVDQRSAARFWATAEVHTDGIAPVSLSMMLTPGARVSGTVVYEGPSAAGGSVTLRLTPVNVVLGRRPGLAVAEVGSPANGRSDFRIANVQPGRYQLEVGDPKGSWTLKSMTVDGRDIQERPLDLVAATELSNVVITMSDQVTELSGTVSFDRTARPLLAVVAFPADSGKWQVGSQARMRGTEVDPQGRYVIRGLLPGDYRVAVVTPEAVGTDMLSMFKRLLPTSVPVSLKLGEARVQNLVLK